MCTSAVTQTQARKKGHVTCVVRVTGPCPCPVPPVRPGPWPPPLSVQEHRPPGSPEQEIYDDGDAKLWDSCDVVAYFSLEVGKRTAYGILPRGRTATW